MAIVPNKGQKDTQRPDNKEAEMATKSTNRPHWAWRLFRGLFILGFICAVAGAVVVGVLYYKYTNDEPLPDPAQVMEDVPPQSSKIFDRNGVEIGAARVPVRRVVLSPEAIPDVIKAAILSAEDKDFFEHGAMDYQATVKAVVQGVLHGFHFRGASGIEQQLAKRLFGTKKVLQNGKEVTVTDRSLRRKVRELAVARQMNARYSKNEILARYLNTVDFGHQRAGVEEASQYYFGKPASRLTFAEAATLASIPNNPRLYVKKEWRGSLKKRRNFVLKEMQENGYIVDPQIYAQAIQAPIVFVNEQPQEAGAPGSGGVAPEFLGLAEDYLHTKYGPDISRLGAKVFTTCDTEIQEATRVALERHLKILRPEWRKPLHAGAALLEVKTGKVIALVGDYQYALGNFNWVTQGLRQPGSTAKPFVLATALNAGYEGRLEIDTATAFYDVALTYQIPGSKAWTPQNYHGEHLEGLVDLRTGMAHSVNTVYAQLMNIVGPGEVVKTMKRLGIKSKQDANLSLVLGSSDVTPLELVNAYRVFANNGMGSELQFIQSENGVDLPSSEPTRRLPAAVAHQMTFVLQDVVEEGTATAAKKAGLGPVAGKTGTTNGSTNAWFVGYTSDVIGIVWVGNEFQNQSMGKGATGASYALPIWIDMMQAAIKKYPNRGFSFTPPTQGAPHLYPGATVPANLPPSEAGDGGVASPDGGTPPSASPKRPSREWDYEE